MAQYSCIAGATQRLLLCGRAPRDLPHSCVAGATQHDFCCVGTLGSCSVFARAAISSHAGTSFPSLLFCCIHIIYLFL